MLSAEPHRARLATSGRLAGAGLLVAGLLFTDAARAAGPISAAPQPPAAETPAAVHRDVLDRYCVTCHSARIVRGEAGGTSPLVAQLRAAGLMLDTLDPAAAGEHAEVWERVVRKLRAGMMPPAGLDPRPACWTTWPAGSNAGSTRRPSGGRTRAARPRSTG